MVNKKEKTTVEERKKSWEKTEHHFLFYLHILSDDDRNIEKHEKKINKKLPTADRLKKENIADMVRISLLIGITRTCFYK